MGGSSSTTDTVPWVGQQPELTNVFGYARNFFEDPSLWPEYYTGDTVADATALQTGAWNGGLDLLNGATASLGGAQTLDTAQTSADSILNGDYFNTVGQWSLTDLMESGGDTSAQDYALGLTTGSPGDDYITSAATATNPAQYTINAMASPAGYLTAQDSLTNLATGATANDLFSSATSAYEGASGFDPTTASALVGASPGYSTLTGLMTDASPTSAETNLGAMASGDLVGANPWLDDMFDSASDSVARTYQTVTAPTTDSTFSSYGLTNSSALQNAVSQNEQNLGDTLNNLAADIYGTAYTTDTANQLTAANTIQNALDTRSALQAGIGSDLGTLYGTLGAADTQAQLDAATGLSGIASTDLATQASAANTLGTQGLSAAELQGNIFSDSANRMLNAGTALNDQAIDVGSLLGTTTQNLTANQLAAATGYNDYTGSVLGNMVNTIGLSPDLAAADWADVTNASTLGAEQQAQQQAIIDSLVEEWNYTEEQALEMLQYYSDLVQGDYGSVSVTSSSGLFG